MDPNVIKLAMGAAGVSGGPQLYAWGQNNNGQLGLGNTTNLSSPVQVGLLSTWSTPFAAGYHSLVTDTSGKAFSFGSNNRGQLGLGNTTYRSSPVQIGALTDWSKFGGGFSHRLAVKTNGTLWSWGSSFYGELGDGIPPLHQKSSPAQVGSSTDWASVSAGTNSVHSLAVKTGGTLWAFGDNDFGELGLGDTTDRSSPTQVGAGTSWSKVATGRKHSAAIKTDGTLWTWGRNNYGQLGDSATPYYRSSPRQVGSGTNWSSVSGGTYFTVAIKTDGTLWSWGRNSSGQLGLGNTTSRSSPTQVGAGTSWSSAICGGNHVIALKTDGTIWGWGLNSTGQLGLGDITNRSSPVQIGSVSTWQNIACGSNFTLATRL
jgi:alpha-tubulin suppressor-like RCC1 family protein